jgi:hypothetical protein
VSKPASRMTRDEIARLDSLHDQDSWTDADLIELNRLYAQFYRAFRHRMFWWQTNPEKVAQPEDYLSHPNFKEQPAKTSSYNKGYGDGFRDGRK